MTQPDDDDVGTAADPALPDPPAEPRPEPEPDEEEEPGGTTATTIEPTD